MGNESPINMVEHRARQKTAIWSKPPGPSGPWACRSGLTGETGLAGWQIQIKLDWYSQFQVGELNPAKTEADRK